MFKERFKRFNSTSLKPSSRFQRNHMLPATPTTITTNNSKFSITNYARFLQRTSKITRERCYLLLIQLLFYTIVIIIIYVRFGQINARQIRILSILNPNHNSTLHQESHNRPNHHNQ